MDDLSIEERVKQEAAFIIENGATVRKTATRFGISKSAVHKDVSFKLKFVDERLYIEVRKVLDKNLKERHLRGGNATKLKYQKLRKSP